MKRLITTIMMWLAMTLLAAPVQAKGDVDRITISGPRLEEPILLGKDTPEMEALNPWFGGYLDGVVEAPPKSLAYTVDFYMDFAAGDTADLRHVYTADYVPDPAGGAGYFYIPGPGDEGYELNKGTIMAAERDGKWHRASARWEAAVRPALRAAGVASGPAPGPSVAPAALPLPPLAIGAGLLVAALGAVAILRRPSAGRLAPDPD